MNKMDDEYNMYNGGLVNEDGDTLYENIRNADNFETHSSDIEMSTGSDGHYYISFEKSTENREHSQNRQCCLDVLFAIFVLPMTAGDLLKSQRIRDGKIASLVSLTFCVGIVIAVLFVSMCSTESDIGQDGEIFRVLMISILFLAIVAYLIFILLRNKITKNKTTQDHHYDILRIKIVFEFIFSIACISFHAIRMSLHFICPEHLQMDNILRIVYDNLIIVFYILQFTFIVLFASKIVFKTCLTYFGATLLVVTNASTFIYHSTKTYFEETEDHINWDDCWNTSTTYRVYHVSKPFLDPTLLENALLSILITTEIFSRCKSHLERVDSSHDNRQLNASAVKQPSEMSGRNTSSCKLRAMVILFALLICVPYFVIRNVQLQYHKEQPYELYIGQTVYLFIFKMMNYLAVITCFYFFQTNGKNLAKSSSASLQLNHYLILLSAFGSVMYFSLHLIASIEFVGRKLYVLGNVMNIIATYIQTILILQLKDFKHEYNEKGKCSVTYVFSFLAFSNFGLWCFNTFGESQYVYKQHYAVEFYGYQTMLTVRNLLIPMLIFYRFKCFLSFLEVSGCSFRCFTPTFVTRKRDYESI